MHYFDGCYLGLPYFDSPPCAAPPAATLGRHVRSSSRRFMDEPIPVPDDQVPFILLAMEIDDG
jgi:hypothetical protein